MLVSEMACCDALIVIFVCVSPVERLVRGGLSV